MPTPTLPLTCPRCKAEILVRNHRLDDITSKSGGKPMANCRVDIARAERDAVDQ